MTQRLMSSLQINLLGPVEVRLAEADLTPTLIHKVKALLAYLAVEAERPHPRQSLAGLLWPERPETVARQNLRQALLRLRQAVGAEYVEASRKSVQFNRAGDVHLDVAEFTSLITAWRRHDHTAPEMCAACAARLEEAAALYRGDFLAQFFLEDSAPFEEWASLKREWLRTEALQALHQLAAYHQRQSDYEAAQRFAWRQVELDPLREEARRQVMRLLALQGRRSEALAQYETCRQVLADELGVEPSAETAALYERIRNGELGKRAEEPGHEEDLTPAPLPPSPSAPLHNLPAQTTPFVGRERELADLARLLDQPDNRLVTIFAPGGMGKTRLALEGAAAQVERYPSGVYLVPLAPLSEPETMVSAIAEGVGYPFQADKRSPRQQLLDYFREKEMLLVLDNFEHLLEGVDLVTAILQSAPGVRILVTSRERLRLSGETVFSLEGMDYPEPETRPGGDYSAVKLFIQSAQRVQPAFAPTGEEVEAIARICRLVAGMPLGILLAASWAEMLTPREIVAEIEQGFDFLESDLRDLPERQRSLRAVFAQTWRRLTEAERNTFMKLSVFRGGFTREAAQSVTGASLRTLAALVNKALLQGEPRGRYEIHELVRQYTEEQLEAAGQGEAAREAHCAYYLDFLGQRQADLKGGRQVAAVNEIATDYQNIQVAWNWALKHRQIGPVAQAVAGLGQFYLLQGHYQEGETTFHSAADALATAGPGKVLTDEDGARLPLVIKLWTWQSVFNRKLGHTEQVRHLLERSLALLDAPQLAEQDTRAEKAFILLEMGRYWLSSDHEHAKALYEQSLDLYQALDDRWGAAQGLACLGYIAYAAGSHDEAKPLLEEALAMQQALGDLNSSREALGDLASIAKRREQFEEAEQLYRQSLAISREIGNRAAIAKHLANLAMMFMWIGKFAEAHAMTEESLQIYQDLGFRLGLAEVNGALGYAELHLGQYRQARRHLQESLTYYRAVRDHTPNNAWTLFNLGRLALAEETYAEAQSWLEQSAAIMQEIALKASINHQLASLGYTARGLDHQPEARRYLVEALRIGAETPDIVSLLDALPAIALLLADQAEPERAVELYALASRYPYVANSRWFEDVAGRYIAAIAERLPPKVVAAAQERGKARDLWATAEGLLAELEE